MTAIELAIHRAARGLGNTSPPKWLRRLAHPVRPAELGLVKRAVKGKVRP